jgi:hypothetical protein
VKTISQQKAYWRKQLTTMSAIEVNHEDHRSHAQMLIWGLPIQVFISCAAKYELVSRRDAKLITETIRDWKHADLPTRLAIVSFVVDTVVLALGHERDEADQLFGELAMQLSAVPQLMSLLLRVDVLGPEAAP